MALSKKLEVYRSDVGNFICFSLFSKARVIIYYICHFLLHEISSISKPYDESKVII